MNAEILITNQYLMGAESVEHQKVNGINKKEDSTELQIMQN